MEVSTDATAANEGSSDLPKVLYTDLDGTLLGPGGSLFAAESGGSTGAAAQALLDLREAGVELVLMSGRTRRGLHEAARVLGASGYIAELGSSVVLDAGREILENRGSFDGDGRPVDAIVRSGAGALLLERFAGRLAPVAPWSEGSMMFQGHIDPAEAEAVLDDAGLGWLAMQDNGRLRRRLPDLEITEVRAYHLLPRGVTKASGVRLHMERIGVAPAATAAIGDSLADLAVAPVVGRFFLVANGRSALGDVPLPENATVTAAPHGDGFAEAVRFLIAR
jgi:hydroxymethylpyrimidine pyrophosphatase-like HAD family hydrolase